MDKLLSGRRILVVEDDMLNLAMLEDILAEDGCEVRYCCRHDRPSHCPD